MIHILYPPRYEREEEYGCDMRVSDEIVTASVSPFYWLVFGLDGLCFFPFNEMFPFLCLPIPSVQPYRLLQLNSTIPSTRLNVLTGNYHMSIMDSPVHTGDEG